MFHEAHGGEYNGGCIYIVSTSLCLHVDIFLTNFQQTVRHNGDQRQMYE